MKTIFSSFSHTFYHKYRKGAGDDIHEMQKILFFIFSFFQMSFSHFVMCFCHFYYFYISVSLSFIFISVFGNFSNKTFLVIQFKLNVILIFLISNSDFHF